MRPACLPAILSLILLAFCLIPSSPAFSQGAVNVTTWHNDNAHTGQNLQETILTPKNVNPGAFGKLFSYPVDGMLYAQPLYVQGLTINGATHNVVFAATENDSVYAFDADSAALNPAPLWKTAFANPPSVTAVPCTENDQYCNIYPIIGISGTPVINLANQTLYVVTRAMVTPAKGPATYNATLHALNILTGAEQPHSPVVICSAAGGRGCNFPPYTTTPAFIPEHQMQRPALTLTPYPGTQQGVLYVAFGEYRGWLMAFDAATLQLLAVFCTAPDVQISGKGLSGFWGSGGAISADAYGNLYAVTADGVFDVDTGGPDYGDTLMKLSLVYNSTSNSYAFQVLDYFSPEDQTCRYANDVDLGSGSPLILPAQLGASSPDLVLIGGKGYPCDGTISPIFTVDGDNMGEASGNAVQTVDGPTGGYWSGGAYWQTATTTYLYYAGLNSETVAPVGDYLRMWTMVGGLFSPPTAVAQSPHTLEIGATPSISANGQTNGILWAIARQDLLSSKPGKHPAILYAFDATNVANQLYSSTTNATRDTPGAGVKFAVPTIANGKVYVGTQTELDVYGRIPRTKLTRSKTTKRP